MCAYTETTETTVTQRNTDLVRRLFDAFTDNDAAEIDRLLGPGFTAHGLPPQLGEGAAAIKASAAMMHGGLRDCRCEMDDVIAEGDRVAVRYTARATHVGELFGVPPSGRNVTITGIEIYRVDAGAIVEYWGVGDFSDVTG